MSVKLSYPSCLRFDRPNCKTRRISACSKAPPSEFAGPSAVTTILRRSIDRAGLLSFNDGWVTFNLNYAQDQRPGGDPARLMRPVFE
jgi:hypothetical protein